MKHPAISSRVLPGLSLLAVLLLVADYLLPAGQQQLNVANASWTTAGLVAVLGVASARARRAREDRSGWTLLLIGCVLWLVGQGFWDLFGVTSFPSSPNPADICWLAFAIFVVLGVHRLGTGTRPPWRVTGLEIAPLMVAVLALTTALFWPVLQDSVLPAPAKVTTLAYPVAYVCAAVVLLQAVVAGALDVRRNPGVGVLLGGLAIEALAFIFWAPGLLAGSYTTGTHVVDALWAAGMIGVGVGAQWAGPCAAVADAEAVARRRGGVLPSLTFVVLAAVQLLFVVRDHATGANIALSLGVTTVGLSLIARASVLRRAQTSLLTALHAREAELLDTNRFLGLQSRQDALTGLGNRLALREDFARLLDETGAAAEEYCVVLCDLDRFKDYNDANGHQAGDKVLRRVAELLRVNVRSGHSVYRYGGEELLILVTHADEATGRVVAERHREELALAALPHPHGIGGLVTLSAGVAAARRGETPDMVLRRADEALYRAKALGRNRTETTGDRVDEENTERAIAAGWPGA